MIVPMKKITIIVRQQDAEATVKQVRALGVLHIEHQAALQGKDITNLQDDLALVNTGLEILNKIQAREKKPSSVNTGLSDWRKTAVHIIDLWKRHEHLDSYSRTLIHNINEWEQWGDFDPQEIKELIQKGIFVKLFRLFRKQIKEFPKEVIARSILTRGGISYCLAIAGQPFEVPFQEIPLPRQGLSQMRRRLEEDKKVMAQIRAEILKIRDSYSEFLKIRQHLHKDIEFFRVVNGMGKEETLAYVCGYAPQHTVTALRQKARENAWGLLINEPADDDVVPTLLRNPAWVDAIKPVFRLLEIIPGYRELDISPLFLCFLSLFFGMIIGDAGYGAVYFLLALWLRKKFAPKIKDTRFFSLACIFSACAIFWGLLTGTVFGQEWYLNAGLKPFIPVLNDTKFLQAFCFFLGAFHLTLGHSWQAVRKAPSLTALADIGWVCVLWAAFFLAKTLILDDPFPFFCKWLIIAGISLVILCTSPQRNIFKRVGRGLAAVALSLMNNFTDVVSYIRLFAVGLATVAIADTVNTLAAGFAGTNPLAKILILFVGHTVNIILGPMSVLVHGVRLNILEFSNHANLSWSGAAYKPLRE